MLRQLSWIRSLLLVLVVWLALLVMSSPAQAAAVDSYVIRYLKATEPVPIELDAQGHTRLVSPQELSEGKRLFEANCKSCHVGGATLPNPLASLSLQDLKGATPPRNHIDGLVAYFRQPMLYDGSEEASLCRQVPESWMSQSQVESLAAFILKAAEKAPGWGTNAL